LSVDAALFVVGLFRPGRDFLLQNDQFANAAATQALAGQATEFAFRNVQPTAVLRCVAEVKTAKVRAGLLRFKGFVESAHRVRIQIVHHQSHQFAVGVPRVEQAGDFYRPVHFRALWPGGGRAVAGR